MLNIQSHNHYFRLNTATNEKYILRKMGLTFKTLSSTLFFKITFYIFFVKKNEPFGIKRSRRLFWNKKKWLDKILCFNFLRKQNKASSRNSTLSIPIKIYLRSLLCYHHSQKYFIISENTPGIYDKKIIVFLFPQWLWCWMPLLVICGGFNTSRCLYCNISIVFRPFK